MTRERLERLAERLRSGDRKAFDELYSEAHGAVYAVAYSVLRDRMRAEDVLQETFVTVWRRIESYREGTNFYAWIVTVAKNLAINESHRHAREHAVDFNENTVLGAGGRDETEGWLFELAEKLLDREELEILLLAAVYGYKRREISQMKNMPVSTVSWKYKQAAERLRDAVRRERDL